ncbi:MAG: hypothetical protein ACC667_11700, partial [Longimicrobiales bacterium]
TEASWAMPVTNSNRASWAATSTTIAADGMRIPDAFGPGGLVAYIERDEFDVPTILVKRLPGG